MNRMSLRKIDLMHHLFGELPDRKCKDCNHLISHQQSRKWYKCEIYGDTSSEASDWRLKYTACGMIDNPDYSGNPVMNLWRIYNKKPDEQIEGQVSLFENI